MFGVEKQKKMQKQKFIYCSYKLGHFTWTLWPLSVKIYIQMEMRF